MAAKKRTVKTKSVKPVVKSAAQKREPWYAKYSYSRGEVLYRLAWLALLVFVFFQYRGLVVAANVNGEPVSRLSVIQELEKQQGQQVLDNLINETIIRQQANGQNVIVADEEVDARIGEIEGQLTEQGQNLDDILGFQGMTRDDLVKQIKIQLTAEKLLENRIEISEEEIKQIIDTGAATFPEGATDEEKREIAREQVRQQKLSQEFSTWLQEQRDGAKIEFFVEY